MKNAKSLINESPEDEDELNDLMEVVKGYAIVEPDTAFRMFEPVVDQINDFVMASAILSRLIGNGRRIILFWVLNLAMTVQATCLQGRDCGRINFT